jgi:WW domain
MALWTMRVSASERKPYYFNVKTGESRWIPPADVMVKPPTDFAQPTDLLDQNNKHQNAREQPKLVKQEDSRRPPRRRRTETEKQVVETTETESERSSRSPVSKRRRISGAPFPSSYNEIGRWIGLPSSISIKRGERVSAVSALILDSILALRVMPGLPVDHLDPLVDKLTQAYESSRSPPPLPAVGPNPEGASMDDEPHWQGEDEGQSEGDAGSEQDEDEFTVDKLGHWSWKLPKYIVEYSTKIGRDALSEMEESRHQLEKYVS